MSNKFSITASVDIPLSATDKNRLIIGLSQKLDETLGSAQDGVIILRDFTLPAEKNYFTSPIFKMEVDGKKSFEELIAAGAYSRKNSEIRGDSFPVMDKTKRSALMKHFQFAKTVASDRVFQAIEKENCRPAYIEELLTFGAGEDNCDRQFQIVALGSVNATKCVPILDLSGTSRDIYIRWGEENWKTGTQFLAVLKDA